MHVGMGVIFQGEGEGRTDSNVYRNELRFGDVAAQPVPRACQLPGGFEVAWIALHLIDPKVRGAPRTDRILTVAVQRVRIRSLILVRADAPGGES